MPPDNDHESEISLDVSEASRNELEVRLREAYQHLRERDEAIVKKDKDLVIAAEFGSQLLEDNETLRSELAKVQAEAQHLRHRGAPSPLPSQSSPQVPETPHVRGTPQSTQDLQRRTAALEASAARVIDLEQNVLELQSQLERMQNDLRVAQEAERSTERRVQRFEAENAVITKDLNATAGKCQDLEEEKRKLAKEKGELARRCKELEEVASKAEMITTYKDQVEKLEMFVKQVTANRQEMESQLSYKARELEDLQNQYQELESMMEEYRTETSRQTSRIDELTWDLESARDFIKKLESRLSVLEPQSAGPFTANKTLFSEVEDRRKELESRHQNLSRKHAMLLKAHSVSMHERERMRNHIWRLMQVMGSKESEVRVRILEEALGQVESEKTELAGKVEVTEKKLRRLRRKLKKRGSDDNDIVDRDDEASSDEEWDIYGEDSLADDDNRRERNSSDFELLQHRLHHLTTHCATMQKSLRTAEIIRNHESEKLRNVETILREREDELGRIKRLLAKARWETDELRARLRAVNENPDAIRPLPLPESGVNHDSEGSDADDGELPANEISSVREYPTGVSGVNPIKEEACRERRDSISDLFDVSQNQIPAADDVDMEVEDSDDEARETIAHQSSQSARNSALGVVNSWSVSRALEQKKAVSNNGDMENRENIMPRVMAEKASSKNPLPQSSVQVKGNGPTRVHVSRHRDGDCNQQ
ncbi:hypothetical protein BC832DRAFT_591683 [Gaertneriomyces semiglobifer]|nr:hypothetical protein BC832DRAFT_591683 [Gaertneriomyces semiglobifer]